MASSNFVGNHARPIKKSAREVPAGPTEGAAEFSAHPTDDLAYGLLHRARSRSATLGTAANQSMVRFARGIAASFDQSASCAAGSKVTDVARRALGSTISSDLQNTPSRL